MIATAASRTFRPLLVVPKREKLAIQVFLEHDKPTYIVNRPTTHAPKKKSLLLELELVTVWFTSVGSRPGQHRAHSDPPTPQIRLQRMTYFVRALYHGNTHLTLIITHLQEVVELGLRFAADKMTLWFPGVPRRRDTDPLDLEPFSSLVQV